MTGTDVIDHARAWVGTPYIHQARGPRGPLGGTDCVGLLIGVAKELGLIFPDYDPTGYKWETDGTQLTEELSKWADLIWAEGELSVPITDGDIMTFRIAGLPQHTGFISTIDYGGQVKAPGLIHAYNPAGEVVEHRLDDRWRNRAIQVWRLRLNG